MVKTCRRCGDTYDMPGPRQFCDDCRYSARDEYNRLYQKARRRRQQETNEQERVRTKEEKL